MKDPKEYLNFNDYGTGKVVGTHNSASSGNAYKSEIVKDVVIPETFENKRITEIGYYAFRDTSIESIFISKYVKEIRWGAFYNCSSLKYVTFDPKSELTTIGTNSFAYTNLSSFNFPSSFSKIGKDSNGYAPFHAVKTLTCVSYLGSSNINFNYLFAYISPLPAAHSSPSYQYKIGTIEPKKDNKKCKEKYYPFMKRQTINYSNIHNKKYLSTLIFMLIIEK